MSLHRLALVRNLSREKWVSFLEKSWMFLFREYSFYPQSQSIASAHSEMLDLCRMQGDPLTHFGIVIFLELCENRKMTETRSHWGLFLISV